MISIGTSKCSKNDWIQIDRGYLDRLAERRATLKANPEEPVAANQVGIPAITELFTQIVEHVIVRFPTLFRQEGRTFQNLVTAKTYNLDQTLKDPYAMLRMISENVEEDFYVMCPGADGQFSLQGYVSLFPGGFLTEAKLGQSMREIHQGVPGLEENIGKGIQRFMTSMRGGSIVQRMNVSLKEHRSLVCSNPKLLPAFAN